MTVNRGLRSASAGPRLKVLDHGFLAKIFRVTPKQLKELTLGTIIYAGLFATEGIGLLLRKRWAEYFTYNLRFHPARLEIFELARHFSVTKL
jgi:uncharacterized membrane protein (DUF2068 family)